MPLSKIPFRGVISLVAILLLGYTAVTMLPPLLAGAFAFIGLILTLVFAFYYHRDRAHTSY